jgi:hypothetical protein
VIPVSTSLPPVIGSCTEGGEITRPFETMAGLLRGDGSRAI